MKGKIFTPVSLVKKTFKHGERSLSREEITQRLHALTQDPYFDAEKSIQDALNHPFSPFREGNSRAIIQYIQESQPLANHVYRLLNESGFPMSEDKILRKLRSLNLVSWNFAFERLGLYGDSRFLQLRSDGQWCNSDWAIVNDEVYAFLVDQGTKELNNRDVVGLLQSKLNLPRNHRLFVPQVDERFLVEEDKLYVLDLTTDVQSVMGSTDAVTYKMDDPVNSTTYSEVAAAMSQEMLTVEQVASKTVVDEVVQDIMSALIKLEQRSSEMKEEVLQHFATNNLGAIEGLIQEKDKNEKVLNKLQEIIDELS